MSTNDTLLKVVKLNNIGCNLVALLDSGSPVSCLRHSSFEKIFDVPLSLQNDCKLVYKALNNTPIATLGSISTNIQLESFLI